ncbi:hypothetical protein KY308_02705, partial [Candidatus Woesearchaeota archaeon]|nr:hypothetical protein [Candidatus Woesearchaeota archaeon]
MTSKTLLPVILILILLAVFIPKSLAEVASKTSIAYPYPGTQPFASNQYYSVHFDEEGEAAVLAKFTIVNAKDSSIDEISVEIPGTSVRIINSVQEAMAQRRSCAQWDDKCVEQVEGQCSKYERTCVSYKTYGTFQGYYSIDYTEQRLSKSTAYKFKLSQEIGPQESATVIIYYKAEGYVKKSFGIYNFDFETAKIKYDVDNVRVAVNVQPELYLKGGQSRVDYLPQIGASFAAEKLSTSVAAESSGLATLSRTIEYQQGYTKQTSGLDPLESFHVEGKYADSWFALNTLSIMLGIII